jgi:hypothetical protein
VLDELKRWEDKANCRESFTVETLEALRVQVLKISPASKARALWHWFAVTLQAGCRRVEWAQPNYAQTVNKIYTNPRDDPYAFCLGDVFFLGARKRRLTLQEALADRSQVFFVELGFRWQKNGEHGETKLFSHNEYNAYLDVVFRWLKIVDLFLSLFGEGYDMPLAAYWEPTKSQPQLLNSLDIKIQMRELVISVYRLNGITTPRLSTNSQAILYGLAPVLFCMPRGPLP